MAERPSLIAVTKENEALLVRIDALEKRVATLEALLQLKRRNCGA